MQRLYRYIFQERFQRVQSAHTLHNTANFQVKHATNTQIIKSSKEVINSHPEDPLREDLSSPFPFPLLPSLAHFLLTNGMMRRSTTASTARTPTRIDAHTATSDALLRPRKTVECSSPTATADCSSLYEAVVFSAMVFIHTRLLLLLLLLLTRLGVTRW